MYKADTKYPLGSYENRGEAMLVPVQMKVSPYTLSSIISTAMEGGINYWCSKARLHEVAEDSEGKHTLDTIVTEKHEGEVWNEFISRNVALGGTLTFYEYDESEETETPHKLTKEKLLAGLAKFFENGRTRVSTDEDGSVDFDYDVGDADNIIQYALFGELVYG